MPVPHTLPVPEVPDHLGRECMPHHCPCGEVSWEPEGWPSSLCVTGIPKVFCRLCFPSRVFPFPRGLWEPLASMEQERPAQAGVVWWFPFLVLGNWKREEPGDKSGTRPFSPPFSGGGRSVTFPWALPGALCQCWCLGFLGAGVPLGLLEPFHISFDFTYRDKAGGQRSWKQVHPRPEVPQTGMCDP